MKVEPTAAEMVALAHAVDPALRMLNVVAYEPVQGEAMHKVIGYHAFDALQPVGWAYWLKDHWHLCAEEPTGQERRQRVYLVVEPEREQLP